MGIPSLLGNAIGKARAERARWVLDLDELQHLCLPARTWVSLYRDGDGEFARIWMRSRKWSGLPSDTPRRLAVLLQQRVRELLRLTLEIETPEESPGCQRVHVGAPELRAVVELDLREAEQLLRQRGAVEPLEELEEELPRPLDVVANYLTKRHTLRDLSRRHGTSRMILRRILASEHAAVRPSGRRPIEDVRSPEVVAKALEAAQAGESVSAIARILVASRKTALRFLARQGR